MRRLLIVIVMVLLASPARADIAACRTAFINDDMKTTNRECRPLAEAGLADGQYIVGMMYGLFAVDDRAPPEASANPTRWFNHQALAWFRKAAAQGNGDALSALGDAYRTGDGVAKDNAAALAWYLKAAEQGHGAGRFNMAVMYHLGLGVAPDLARAHMWYALSHEAGFARAAAVRDMIAQRLSPAQLAKAHRRARAWRAAHGE